jgi:hypothetical protein
VRSALVDAIQSASSLSTMGITEGTRWQICTEIPPRESMTGIVTDLDDVAEIVAETSKYRVDNQHPKGPSFILVDYIEQIHTRRPDRDGKRHMVRQIAPSTIGKRPSSFRYAFIIDSVDWVLSQHRGTLDGKIMEVM